MIAITTSNSISVNPRVERFMGNFKRMAPVRRSLPGAQWAHLGIYRTTWATTIDFFGYPKFSLWNIDYFDFDAMNSPHWDF